MGRIYLKRGYLCEVFFFVPHPVKTALYQFLPYFPSKLYFVHLKFKGLFAIYKNSRGIFFIFSQKVIAGSNIYLFKGKWHLCIYFAYQFLCPFAKTTPLLRINLNFNHNTGLL